MAKGTTPTNQTTSTNETDKKIDGNFYLIRATSGVRFRCGMRFDESGQVVDVAESDFEILENDPMLKMKRVEVYGESES